MMMTMSTEIYRRSILIIIGDNLMTMMIEIVMTMFIIFVLQEEIHIDCDDDNKNNADDIHNFFALQKEGNLEPRSCHSC